MGAAASVSQPPTRVHVGRTSSAPVALTDAHHQQQQWQRQQQQQQQQQHLHQQLQQAAHQAQAQAYQVFQQHVPEVPSAPPAVVTTSWPTQLPAANPGPTTRPTPQQLPAPTGRNPATATDEGVRLCCKFRLRDLSQATNNFSSVNVIGEGGFGKVYKGTLVDGTEVAVKRLDPLSLQGDREFYAEVALLTRLRHPNLVCIMGMCDEDDSKLGVFEFMKRGSLRDLLDKKLVSSWIDRLAIAIGSARGLTYLHEMSEPPVIHCDFKSSNVLIDGHGQAHVADFGLARHIGGARPQLTGGSTFSQASDVTTVTSIRGTFGYLSPEYLEQGHASVRADVFAFGVVLLELMTAQQAVDASRGRGREPLADWARPMLRQPEVMMAMLDPCIADQAPAVQVAVLCEVAEACLRPNPRERPSMLEVVRTLSAASTYSELASPRPPPAVSSSGTSAQRPERPAAQPPVLEAARPGPSSSGAAPHTLLAPPRLELNSLLTGGWGPGSPIAQPLPLPASQGGVPRASSTMGRRLMPIESIRNNADADGEAPLPVPLPVPASRPSRAEDEAPSVRETEPEGLGAYLQELTDARHSDRLVETVVPAATGSNSFGFPPGRPVLPSIGAGFRPRPSPVLTADALATTADLPKFSMFGMS